jgi:hypothetical protein
VEEASPPEINCDLLIIGAGIAGQAVASQVNCSKIKVLMVDGGNQHSFRAKVDTTHSPIRLNLGEDRAFGLGGTSTKWGGNLVPYTRLELSSKFWPEGIAEALEHELESALNFLGFEKQSSAVAGEWRSSFLGLDAGKLTIQSFFRKNSPDQRVLPSDTLDPKVQTLTGVWVKNINESEDGSFANCVGPNNKDLRIRFKSVVISSGGLESLRILFNSAADLGISSKLGQFWSPHQTGIIGLLTASRPMAIGETVEGALIRHRYIHVSSTTSEGTSGWKVTLLRVRTSLLELPKLGTKAAVVLYHLVLAQLRGHELFMINVDGDQVPSADSKVVLNDSGALSVVHSIEAEDRESLKLLMSRLEEEFKEHGKFLFFKSPQRLFSGKSHHLGGARMADSKADGVVDKNLRVFGSRSVFVCSAATFSTFSSANPTLTLTQMGIRLGKYLDEAFRTET